MNLKNDPTTLIKMQSGFACMGFNQFLEGYCVLFSDPVVPSLNDLSTQNRTQFLLDMSIVGDAIIEVCQPLRVNYGILGNSHPHLHAHLFPRYETEPEHLKTRNVWQYPEEYWTDKKYKFDEVKHRDLKAALTNSIKNKMKDQNAQKN